MLNGVYGTGVLSAAWEFPAAHCTKGATMSVDQKPTLPFFTGTYREVGDRILSTPLTTLLEATLAEPNTWGVLILRLMMEQTPISEAMKGETPIGLHIRNHILFEKYCSTFFECAFKIYGAEVWGVIEEEVARVAENNVYPELLIARLHDILRFDGIPMRHFTEWTLGHPSSSRLLRLLSALGLSGNWELAGRAVLSLHGYECIAHDELMRVCRQFMMEHRALFSLEELVAASSDKNMLPELRAAMFSILYDEHKKGSRDQLLFLCVSSFIEDPGNATALHAVAWRIAKVLPQEAIHLFGRKLRNMDYHVFQPRETQTRWSYSFCSMVHHAAIWQYFYNMPAALHLALLKQENLSFPEALAGLVRLSDKNVQQALGELFHAAHSRTWEIATNHEYLYTLMLMFSKHAYTAPGRPEWDRVKCALQFFPAEVQRSCVEIAHRLNRLERGEAAPDVAQLVLFVKTIWDAESRYNRYSFFRKQLVEIRNILDHYGLYPEAVLELTNLIAERRIRDNDRIKFSK